MCADLLNFVKISEIRTKICANLVHPIFCNFNLKLRVLGKEPKKLFLLENKAQYFNLK